MENFKFHNPVKIIFGADTIPQIKKEIPTSSKVIVIYGGGSIKKNGVYEQVMNSLSDYQVVEFSGIEPNPEFETCMKAVECIKANKVDYILAVGGGSVLDASKFIAGAVNYEGDPWEILAQRAPITKALPLGTVLTLPATGSEMNSGGVITRAATEEKLVFGSPLLFPQFSVLDPKITYSLPKRQLINGVIDAFIHVVEQYLTYPVNSPVQDRFAEGLMLTLIEEGPKNITDGEVDYNTRANLVWTATMALNGLISAGVHSDWATHLIGHEITAFHGIDHGITLAIVLPELMRNVKGKRKEKLLQYAERVWNVKEGSNEEKIEKAIQMTDDFFISLGAKVKLSEHGIGKETIERISQRFQDRGLKTIGYLQDINIKDVEDILAARL